MTVIAHDEDFFLWTRQQAEALRRLAETRPNVDVDWPNLIEEIEDLGRQEPRAIKSRMRVVLAHLLQLACSPDEYPRRHWRSEIVEQRSQLHDLIADSPSLRPHLQEFLASSYPSARKQVAEKLGIPVSDIPMDCPFTLAHVLDDDWYPAIPERSAR